MAVEHMVWIKFHDGVSDRRIAEHMTNLERLRETVPGILELTVGENFTDRSGGFTHGLLVRLESRKALERYAQHPDHVAVAEPLKQDAELRALDIGR
mgnify:CR=1 FL=1